MAITIGRRRFITLLSGAAVWPLAARAQQGQRMRRIGVLMNLAADDPESQVRAAGFLQGLQELGWTVGRNVQIEWRWDTVDHRDRYQTLAAELVAHAPDVLLTSGPAVRPMQQATRTIPIVFAGLNDPVASGVIRSLARPGGNVTGFSSIEYGVSGKWLELLKQIAPHVTRVAVSRDPGGPGGTGQFGVLQGTAPLFGVEVSPVDASDPEEIERAITAFAHGSNGGLIVTQSASAVLHGDLLITLAARHRMPTVYPSRVFVIRGGLISYGDVSTDVFRRAAGYVDRILKGEKPADLPVQAPTKYETVVNLKTAKALGLSIPPGVLAIADEVIE
jgi:putative ABC transport system substrate-binding protein